MTDDYQAEIRAARALMMELLDPQTAREHRTATWLLTWDLGTLQDLAVMISRNR